MSSRISLMNACLSLSTFLLSSAYKLVFFFSPFPYVAGFLFGPVSSSASVYNHVRLPMHVLYSMMSVAVLAKVVEASVAEVLVIHLFFAYKLEGLFFSPSSFFSS